MHTKFLAIYSVLALCVSAAAGAAEYKAGEVIVKYKDGSFRSRVMMNDLYDAVGAKSIKRYQGMMAGYEHIVLQDAMNVDQAVQLLRQNPAVEYVQPNYILRIQPIKEVVAVAPNAA